MSQAALSFAEKALQLARKTPQEETVMFEIYFNLGIQSEKLGNYDLAMSCFHEAADLSGNSRTELSGNVFNHIGNIAFAQGRYDISMEYYPKAMEIRMRLGDRKGQASSYLNIGSVYQKEGKYKEAQKQYEKSLDICVQLNDDMGKADCFNNLGSLWLEQNNYRLALEYYQQSEDIYHGNNQTNMLLAVYGNIGLVYGSMGDLVLAQDYYFKMLQTSRVLSSPSNLAETYYSLGTFFDESNQTDSAIFYYGKALEIAYPSKLYEVQYLASQKRGELNARIHRYREAYNDCTASRSAYDSVSNIKTAKAFVQKSMQYEFDMQQQQQLYQNRIQKIYIIALLVVVLLIGAVGFALYRSYVQKKKANTLLAKQQQEITDSIRYASLIQQATLPPKEYSDRVLPEHFIYFRPRDIVSGDFYWINRVNGYTIVAVADCTGHGVPGAIVSMLGISSLNKITSKMEVPKADEILNGLREEVIRMLNPVGSADSRQDGMDIALVVINSHNREIEFAGAYNPLYMVRDEQLFEKKANRMPVGLFVKNAEPFTSTRFGYVPGDLIYLFSDGYSDQFGGPDGSKYKTKNFKNLLLVNSLKPLEEQIRILDQTHLQWRGMFPQIDDILVVGIKLE